MRAPEAGIHQAWAEALATAAPEDTVVGRTFSGRAGRSLLTGYVRAAMFDDAPQPAPYPVQRGLTAAMRVAAIKAGDVSRMQAWAGQSAGLARAEPAQQILERLWGDALAILRY
jgi:nitronate monooxygenase